MMKNYVDFILSNLNIEMFVTMTASIIVSLCVVGLLSFSAGIFRRGRSSMAMHRRGEWVKHSPNSGSDLYKTNHGSSQTS